MGSYVCTDETLDDEARRLAKWQPAKTAELKLADKTDRKPATRK